MTKRAKTIFDFFLSTTTGRLVLDDVFWNKLVLRQDDATDKCDVMIYQALVTLRTCIVFEESVYFSVELTSESYRRYLQNKRTRAFLAGNIYFMSSFVVPLHMLPDYVLDAVGELVTCGTDAFAKTTLTTSKVMYERCTCTEYMGDVRQDCFKWFLLKLLYDNVMCNKQNYVKCLPFLLKTIISASGDTDAHTYFMYIHPDNINAELEYWSASQSETVAHRLLNVTY